MDLKKYKNHVVNIQLKFGFDIRGEGTALYAQYGTKEYLVTSRHLLFEDCKTHERLNPEIVKAKRMNEQNTIATAFLNEEFGGPDYNIFIDKHDFVDVDLAVISLEHKKTEEFRRSLRNDGYVPFELQDKYESLNLGAEIFTVGFPDYPSLTSREEPEFGKELKESTIVSQPVFSFGRVSLHNEDEPYCWGDLSISAGSSGGPVFNKDGELVGIIQGQSINRTNTNKGIIETRGLFARMVKAKYIIDLVRDLQEKQFSNS
ncbi:S1 family peptidase [Bacillus atrophaeus]|uniref:S1 family peptidase n=1 Tax=Bacillus atrophaeus TaxID=1452 RepID=UPI00227FAD18|nr:serine protease [Bacillus atrophaeus]MCY8505084.1 serine protease [Bacillus atrophaeus]MCY8968855.1 serine protease [Bacillus atrophaeus]